jgi:Flp pilus assembly pilin Flp
MRKIVQNKALLRLVRPIKGAAMVEYIVLLALISIVVLFSLPAYRTIITEKFDDVTVELSDSGIPGGGGPGGGDGPTGPSGPEIIITDWGRIIDGQPCPDAASSMNWAYDPYNHYYVVPGTATPHPSLGMWVGRHVTAFDGPPEHTSKIYPNGGWDEYNYWGNYIGITLFIWDTWDWTGKIYFDDIQGTPHSSCTTITYPDPNGGADPGMYAGYYPPTNGGTFLEGTPGGDTLNMNDGNGPYVGVYARGWPDEITDTVGGEVIIGGGDDERFSSRGGADTYLWAPGDGSDVYRPLNSGPGTDRIVLRGVTRPQVGMSISGSNLILSMPTGERMTVELQSGSNSDNWVEEIVFDDGAFDPQDFYDGRVASQKSSGSIEGTNRPEAYRHTASLDGSYSILESTGDGNGDTLRFTETNYPDASFDYADGGRDLTVTLPDGDVVTITDYFSNSSRRVALTFADGQSPTFADIKNAADRSARARGMVYGTDGNDAYVHEMAVHGSYRIAQDPGGTDSLTFVDAALADATFVRTGDFDMEVRLTDGDVITLTYILHRDDDHKIESFVFTDVTLTEAEIRDKMIEDGKSTGAVRGTDDQEFYEHTVANDGSYTIYDYRYQYYNSGNDRLTFTDAAIADASFSRVGDDLQIEVGGDRITIIDMWERGVQEDIEEIAFTDGMLNLQQIRDKMVADMKSTGAVLGTDDAENYFHSVADDGSYTIYDYRYQYHNAGDDVLTFTDAAAGEAVFSRVGDDLRIEVGGDTITIIDMMERSSTQDIERIVFTNGSLNMQQIRDKMVADMKPSGAVVGTDDAENYFHSVAQDGNYTVYDYRYQYHNAGNDVFTVTDASSISARFINIGGDDLELRVGGDTITFLDVLHRSSTMDIERFVFTDRSLTEREMRDKMVSDMKSTGAVVGSQLAETFVHRPGDGSYTLTDTQYSYDAQTDILHMPDNMASSVNATRSGNNLILSAGGETITIIDQFRHTNYGVDQIRFADTTWDRGAMSIATE